jgi:hypothetical protein
VPTSGRSILRNVTACFLHNEPASYSSAARLSDERSRSESESEQGDLSRRR